MTNWYKKAQLNTLNLLISSENDLRTAFDLMEFDGFFDYSINKDEYSIGGSIKMIERDKENRIKEKQWAEENKEEWIEEEDDPNEILVGSIYGSGGWNRYFIKRNGNILFSSGHASNKQDIQNAKDLGFEIF